MPNPSSPSSPACRCPLGRGSYDQNGNGWRDRTLDLQDGKFSPRNPHSPFLSESPARTLRGFFLSGDGRNGRL